MPEALSGALKWLPGGSQWPPNDAKKFTSFAGEQVDAVPALRERPPAPTYVDIVLSRMRAGQEIELEAHAVKGLGKTHAKWSPVATARYKMLPEANASHLPAHLSACLPAFVTESGVTSREFLPHKRHPEFQGGPQTPCEAEEEEEDLFAPACHEGGREAQRGGREMPLEGGRGLLSPLACVVFKKPVEGEFAEELVKRCPVNVFDIEDMGAGASAGQDPTLVSLNSLDPKAGDESRTIEQRQLPSQAESAESMESEVCRVCQNEEPEDSGEVAVATLGIKPPTPACNLVDIHADGSSARAAPHGRGAGTRPRRLGLGREDTISLCDERRAVLSNPRPSSRSSSAEFLRAHAGAGRESRSHSESSEVSIDIQVASPHLAVAAAATEPQLCVLHGARHSRHLSSSPPAPPPGGEAASSSQTPPPPAPPPAPVPAPAPAPGPAPTGTAGGLPILKFDGAQPPGDSLPPPPPCAPLAAMDELDGARELARTQSSPRLLMNRLLIRLGCLCKNELALAHYSCALRWFFGRGTTVCEICGQVANGVRLSDLQIVGAAVQRRRRLIAAGVNSRLLAQDLVSTDDMSGDDLWADGTNVHAPGGARGGGGDRRASFGSSDSQPGVRASQAAASDGSTRSSAERSSRHDAAAASIATHGVHGLVYPASSAAATQSPSHTVNIRPGQDPAAGGGGSQQHRHQQQQQQQGGPLPPPHSMSNLGVDFLIGGFLAIAVVTAFRMFIVPRLKRFLWIT
eukprot:jgi/Mesen1/8758/ME000524S08055